MTLAQSLLRLSDAYCAARSVSEPYVSGIIFKNSRTLPRVRAGGDLITRSYERAINWFRENWPDNAEWPAGVDRQPLPTRAKRKEPANA
ncbi:hypothetical protein NKW43_13260 [Gluconobacter albidus]|uniref:hypothetical protein n=1 Tax=Gluconobacter albidus TaxID=318683 RepID=UPI00209E267A|nr:hypothetical protein [Gluconobacter albidus]MCP1274637.1 hypothetical protein [Gluconobacter albidus]